MATRYYTMSLFKEVDIMDIWLKALRRAYRFDCDGIGGYLNTEDLFDLDLNQLDGIYQKLNTEMKEMQGTSLLNEKPEETEWLQGKIDVVKGVFDIKKAEAEAAIKAAQSKAMKDKIDSIIAQKQDAALADMSIEDLQAMKKEL